MSWNSILSLISSVALFLPVALILLLKLGAYRSFPALIVYYLIVCIHNLLTAGFISADFNLVHYLGIGNNIVDAPLMLFFLTYFSGSKALTRKMHILIMILLAFAIYILFWKGVTVKSVTIIMAPGILAVFLFCCYFFIRQTKITIMHRKATGKALMVAALLFAYGCYAIIYLIYYVFKTQYISDTYIVYYMVTIFSSMLLCAGIGVERKRVQKLEELKITRKELSLLYKESRKNRMQ